MEDHSPSSDENEVEKEHPQPKEEEKQPIAEPVKTVEKECDLNAET